MAAWRLLSLIEEFTLLQLWLSVILFYVIFFALLPLEVVFFLFLATLVDFSFSIPTVMILAYLFITEGLPLSLTSDIRG